MNYTLNEKLRNRIFFLLEAARQFDPEHKRFGASAHKYRLGPVIAPEELDALLEKYHFSIPDDLRWFVTEVGNGGAGPFFGLVPFDASKEEHYKFAALPVDGTIEGYYGKGKFSTKEEESWEEQYARFCGGTVYICNPGGDESVRLMVSGEHSGRVIYTDDDNLRRFFPPEPEGSRFIDWYMTWLEESASGFAAGNHGFTVPGTLEEVFERFLGVSGQPLPVRMRHALSLFKARGVHDRPFVPEEAPTGHMTDELAGQITEAFLREEDSGIALQLCQVLEHYGQPVGELLHGMIDTHWDSNPHLAAEYCCLLMNSEPIGWQDIARRMLAQFPAEAALQAVAGLSGYYSSRNGAYNADIDLWYDDLLACLDRLSTDDELKKPFRLSMLLAMITRAPSYRFADLRPILEKAGDVARQAIMMAAASRPVLLSDEKLFTDYAAEVIDGFLAAPSDRRAQISRLGTALTIINLMAPHDGHIYGLKEALSDRLAELDRTFDRLGRRKFASLRSDMERAFRALKIPVEP